MAEQQEAVDIGVWQHVFPTKGHWILLVGVLSTVVLRKAAAWLRRHKRRIELASKLPGIPLEKLHPWLGSLHIMLKLPRVPGRPKSPDSLAYLEEQMIHYSKQGESLHTFWGFNPCRVPFARLIIMVWDPDIVMQIVGPKTTFVKGRGYDISKPLVGDSVLTLPDGPEWKRHRKLALPGFNHAVLEHLTTVVARLLHESLFPKWDEVPSDGASASTAMPGGRTIDVVDSITRFALDILGEVAFSHSFGGIDAMTNVDGDPHVGEHSSESSLYKTFEEITTVLVGRSRDTPLRPYLPTSENWNFRRNTNRLDSTITRIIANRLQEQELLEEENGSGSADVPVIKKDLLSQLLVKDENGQRLDSKYLLGNTRTFLFAGHDTASTALSFGLWQIAMHPNVQNELLKEVDPLFNDGKYPTYSQLRHLRYLDAVVKEILRLHPGAVIGRTATEETVVGNGKKTYRIPIGAEMVIYPWLIHRHPDFWEDPLEFLPERFLGDPGKRPFLPFSVGHRSCLGKEVGVAEIRATLAHVVHRYKITPPSVDYKVVPFFRMTVNPSEVKLNFQLRNGS